MKNTRFGRAAVLGCLLGLLLVVLLSATGMAESKGQLAFTTQRSLLLVKVVVDGHEMTLIFDTGAERTLINSKDNVERVKDIGVAGNLMHIPLAFVPLDGLGMEKVGADGVLGQDILRQFKSVCINYSTHTITLEVK